MSTPILPELANALERRTLALFVGADLPRGISGVPSRGDIARELARHHGLDESLPLAEVAQRIGQAGNRWTFTAFIRDSLDGAAPQPFHRRLVALVQQHGREECSLQCGGGSGASRRRKTWRGNPTSSQRSY